VMQSHHKMRSFPTVFNTKPFPGVQYAGRERLQFNKSIKATILLQVPAIYPFR
jgi:hypothetical protein